MRRCFHLRLTLPSSHWEGEGVSYYPIPDRETEAEGGEEIITIAVVAIIKIMTPVTN